MPSRLELHNELLKFVTYVYFQPPANSQMKYPCIVYNKTGKTKNFADNTIYSSQQEYQLMVIENNPDSDIADRLETHFEYCGINQYYTVDNLHHTTLNLYY